MTESPSTLKALIALMFLSSDFREAPDGHIDVHVDVHINELKILWQNLAILQSDTN